MKLIFAICAAALVLAARTAIAASVISPGSAGAASGNYADAAASPPVGNGVQMIGTPGFGSVGCLLKALTSVSAGCSGFTDNGTAISTPETLTLIPPALSMTNALHIVQSGPAASGVTGTGAKFNVAQITENTSADPAFGIFGGIWEIDTGGSNENSQVTGFTFQLNNTTASSSGHDKTALQATAQYTASDTSCPLCGPYAFDGGAIVPSGVSVGILDALDGDLTLNGSAGYRIGLQLNNFGSNRGSTMDAGIVFGSSILSGSFNDLFLLSHYYGQQPIATAGSILAADAAMTVANVLNLANVTVTGDIVNTPNWVVTGAGVETVKGITASGRVSVTPVALADAATIAVNAALGNGFTVTLGGNRTLANPTNLAAGQNLTFVITQDGTGSRALAYGSEYKFSGGVAPVLTTAAGAVDVLACYAYDTAHIACNPLIANVR